MEPKTIVVDGMEAMIKPMGTDYIMSDAEEKVGILVDIECRAGAKHWPNPLYVAYYSELVEAYGTCAILAWQGRSVVGFLPFRPKDCGLPELPFCIHYFDPEEPDLECVEQATPIPLSEMDRKMLEVRCLSVRSSLHRQGLGSEMARYLIAWARENGWQRIEGWAFAQSDFSWLPDIAFWEKAAFKRGTARVFDESDPETSQRGFEFAIDLTD